MSFKAEFKEEFLTPSTTTGNNRKYTVIITTENPVTIELIKKNLKRLLHK